MKRQVILQKIFSNFQQMTQWVTTSPKTYLKYYNRAEVLVELLEVEDCGSIGGYDNENPHVRITGFKLYDRFLTLIKKKMVVIQPECSFTVDDLSDYFTKIGALRDTFYN